MKVKLDQYERNIERSADAYRPVLKSTLRNIEGVLDQIRKKKNVNIRISESVLEALKKQSQEEGLPYQTLISSVLHKYVTHRLIDEEVLRRTMQLLSSQRHPSSSSL